MRIEQKLAIPLIIVALGNSINGIIRKENLEYFIFYCLIFFVSSITIQLIKLKKSEKRVSILLLIFSLVALWFDDIRSLFGLMLFTYSLCLSGNNKKYYIVYSSLAVLTVVLRFALYSHSSTGFIIYLAGSAFIIIIYQHYIHPKTVKTTDSMTHKSYTENCKVNQDVVDIVSLRCQGFDWHDINDILELNITADWVRRKATEERKRLGFKNQESFVLYLTSSGIIKPISGDGDSRDKMRDII